MDFQLERQIQTAIRDLDKVKSQGLLTDSMVAEAKLKTYQAGVTCARLCRVLQIYPGKIDKKRGTAGNLAKTTMQMGENGSADTSVRSGKSSIETDYNKKVIRKESLNWNPKPGGQLSMPEIYARDAVIAEYGPQGLNLTVILTDHILANMPVTNLKNRKRVLTGMNVVATRLLGGAAAIHGTGILELKIQIEQRLGIKATVEAAEYCYLIELWVNLASRLLQIVDKNGE